MKLRIAALATMIALPVAAQMPPAASRPDARPELQASTAKVEPRTAKAGVKSAATKAPKKKKARTRKAPMAKTIASQAKPAS